MRRIDIAFLLLATLCLLTGVTMGIVMGIAHDFQLAPVHAHLNLVGWASLALFGLIYKAYPVLARSPLATAHFAAASIGSTAFPFGIYLSIAHQNPALAIGASLLWLVGVIAFLVNLARFAFASPIPRRDRTASDHALEALGGY